MHLLGLAWGRHLDLLCKTGPSFCRFEFDFGLILCFLEGFTNNIIGNKINHYQSLRPISQQQLPPLLLLSFFAVHTLTHTYQIAGWQLFLVPPPQRASFLSSPSATDIVLFVMNLCCSFLGNSSMWAIRPIIVIIYYQCLLSDTNGHYTCVWTDEEGNKRNMRVKMELYLDNTYVCWGAWRESGRYTRCLCCLILLFSFFPLHYTLRELYRKLFFGFYSPFHQKVDPNI